MKAYKEITGDSAANLDSGDLETTLLYSDTDSNSGDRVDVTTTTKGASVLAASCTMANCCIGSGVLAFPQSYRNAGVGTAMVSTVVIGFMMAYTLYLLVLTAHEFKTRTFEDTVLASLGKWPSRLLKVIILILVVGATTGFLVLIGDNATATVKTWAGDHWYTSREFIISMPAVFVALPLSLLPRIEYLAWSSVLAVISVMYIVVIVIIESFVRGHWTNPGECVLTDREGWINLKFDALTCLPICVYALGCHCQGIPLYYSLHNRSMKKMVLVIASTFTLALSLYMIMGTAGFVLFGYSTPDDILDGFGTKGRVPLQAQCGRIAIAMVGVTAFAVQMFPARSIIKSVVFSNPENDAPYWFMPAQVIVLWALTLGLALSGIDISEVFSLIGSSVAVILFFVYPILMGMTTSLGRSLWHRAFLWLLLVVGVAIGMIGTGITIFNMA